MSETGERGVAPVIATVLMVAVVVVVAAVVAVFVLDLGESSQPVAPQIEVGQDLVDDGGEKTIAVTMLAGNAVETDHLYVIGSKPVDIGGPPDSSTPAGEQWASEREAFTESSGGSPPQVGIGDTWEAGETVYLDPDGSHEGVEIGIYWSTQPIEGVNPGTVEGADSYRIADVEF